MRLLLRHKLLVGVVALVAAAGAAGGAYAATQSSSSPQQAYLNDVAGRLHVSRAKLDAALKAALIDRLNAMVKSGQLTQAQANKIEQGIAKGRGRLPFFFGLGFGFGGPGFGGPKFGPPGLFGGPPGFHLGLRMGGLAGPIHAAASYLGLSDTQLLTDLASGKSLAQIAAKQGKSVAGLEQAITTAVKSQLDKLVSAGVITKAQEQRVLSHLSAKLGKLVNRSGHLELRAPKGVLMPAPPAGPPGVPGGALAPAPSLGPPPPST